MVDPLVEEPRRVLWWYAPGMYYPLWMLAGDVAKNGESDTDMDELTEAEFHEFFPLARPIEQDVAERMLARLPKLREERNA